ncbi:MAG TPA: restriction endonuclease subunit S, partial [Gammaproteobacteria bacterium]|nr:restriction endonuclease subunit S [Gammaproteobacteria bacterium]
MMRKGNHERHENGLVPKLRFPEFRDAGEWEDAKLADKDISEFVKDRIPLEQLDIDSYISTENLLSDYAGIKAATNLPPSGSFTSFRKKDVLISNIRPYLKKVWQARIDGSASNDVIVIRAKRKIIDDFLVYILKNDDFINYVMKDAKGVKMPRGDISSIKKYPLCFPSEKEQQKIADCLSSLDDLITAHTKKHEALKAHKKGLMQQLFPAEGKTVPALRISEFEGSGEWELKPFSKYIKLYRGSSPRPIKEYLTKRENGVNWIKIGDTNAEGGFIIKTVSEKITREGAEKSRKVKEGELILANSMSYGATYQLELNGCIYDGWFVLREYEKVFDKQFLLQLLNSTYMQEQYKRLAAGGIVQNISSEIVYSTILPKPSIKEQQRIADFLSSI